MTNRGKKELRQKKESEKCQSRLVKETNEGTRRGGPRRRKGTQKREKSEYNLERKKIC